MYDVPRHGNTLSKWTNMIDRQRNTMSKVEKPGQRNTMSKVEKLGHCLKPNVVQLRPRILRNCFRFIVLGDILGVAYQKNLCFSLIYTIYLTLTNICLLVSIINIIISKKTCEVHASKWPKWNITWSLWLTLGILVLYISFRNTCVMHDLTVCKTDYVKQ